MKERFKMRHSKYAASANIISYFSLLFFHMYFSVQNCCCCVFHSFCVLIVVIVLPTECLYNAFNARYRITHKMSFMSGSVCMCSRGKCNLITIKKISLFYALIVHSTNNRKNEYVVLLCISRHFAKALLELAWNGWRGVFFWSSSFESFLNQNSVKAWVRADDDRGISSRFRFVKDQPNTTNV